MEIGGILFLIFLIALAVWQMISKWQRYRRLERNGSLLFAQVTDIKQETRLVMQPIPNGGNPGLFDTPTQRVKYEQFLYAQSQDPLTSNTYTFRIQISQFEHFHIGETIPIKMNRNNPNEYCIARPKFRLFQRNLHSK